MVQQPARRIEALGEHQRTVLLDLAEAEILESALGGFDEGEAVFGAANLRADVGNVRAKAVNCCWRNALYLVFRRDNGAVDTLPCKDRGDALADFEQRF